MDELSKEFTYKKFIYSQVLREGLIAIYKYTDPNWKSKSYCFDTVVINIIPETTYPNGIFVSEHESYPKDRAWGITAWTFTTLEDAKKKFRELIENLTNKHE